MAHSGKKLWSQSPIHPKTLHVCLLHTLDIYIYENNYVHAHDPALQNFRKFPQGIWTKYSEHGKFRPDSEVHDV